MAHALVFVLAPEPDLPAAGITWDSLLAAQRRGPSSGTALRIFRDPTGGASLDDLIASGAADASGSDPFPTPSPRQVAGPSEPEAPRRRLICDAIVPHLDTSSLWLGVYECSGTLPARAPVAGPAAPWFENPAIRCLDRFPLGKAENETCWFYPTEDGAYLCWQSGRQLELLPGYLPEQPLQEEPSGYQRGDVTLLWSLMADDRELTCVGLTWRRRRIDWPLASSSPEATATWTSFLVDSMAEVSYRQIASAALPQG